MRQKWAMAVKRKDWKPNNSSVLCSKHFKPEDFDRSSPFVTLVKRDVIPSIFPDCPEGYPETQIQIDPTKPKVSGSDLVIARCAFKECSMTYMWYTLRGHVYLFVIIVCAFLFFFFLPAEAKFG